jgi:hypothetical protein
MDTQTNLIVQIRQCRRLMAAFTDIVTVRRLKGYLAELEERLAWQHGPDEPAS